MAEEYIRKADAKNALEEKVFHNLTDEFYGAMQALEELESADVAPVVHGEWGEKEVIHERCIEEWQSARCSVCGKYHTTPYMYYFDSFKFCPNCGAKMDGGKRDG